MTKQGPGSQSVALCVAACIAALVAGCAIATGPGPVQEGPMGTNSIRVGRTTGIAQGNKALNDAIDKAGEYCHAKGHKLVVLGNPDQTVISFRCGDPI